MFIDNEFTIEYFNIIEKYKNKSKNGYMEKHHIIPKSFGGSNEKHNTVWLSASDHFNCHKLLINMTEGPNKVKMWYALWRMMNKQSHNQQREYEFSKEEYEEARISHSLNHSKNMLGKNNYFYGKKHSIETKLIMSNLKKGKTYDDLYGTEKATEMRIKRSQEQLGKLKGPQKIIKCPHCHKEGGVSIMHRWHGNNCKMYTKSSDIVE